MRGDVTKWSRNAWSQSCMVYMAFWGGMEKQGFKSYSLFLASSMPGLLCHHLINPTCCPHGICFVISTHVQTFSELFFRSYSMSKISYNVSLIWFWFYFLEKRCPILSMPPNGGFKCIDGAYFNSRCEYYCSPGYQLKGDRIVQCMDNKVWSGRPASCVGKCRIQTVEGEEGGWWERASKKQDNRRS